MKLSRLWRRHEPDADQLATSQQALEDLENRVAPAVHQTAANARRIRVENHLGPTLAAALEGRKL